MMSGTFEAVAVETDGVADGVDVLVTNGFGVAEFEIRGTVAVVFCRESTGATPQETKVTQRMIKKAGWIDFVIG